jgi:(R,R)-butanediol dehydrogenase/meso-butanediol dehydrogenase/diacetyl reductase
VVEVGPGVSDFAVGERVAPDTLLFCGECWACRQHLVHQCQKLSILGLMTDGGCAEYANVPTYMCFKLPPHVSSEVGALAEPAAVAVRAVRIAGVAPGSTVAIVGGGTIGLLCLQVALAAGASAVYVVELEERRRKLAQRLGAALTIDPIASDPVKSILEATHGRGADVVIEAGGNETTMSLAPQLARAQGTVVIIGLHNEPVRINLFPVVCKEIAIRGSFSHIYDVDFSEAVALLGAGKIQADPLISARLGIDQLVEDGLEALLRNKSEHLKILISPQR